jgi:ribose transport system ATP-binding protein
VMSQHRVVGELSRPEFSEERILQFAYQGEQQQARQ